MLNSQPAGLHRTSTSSLFEFSKFLVSVLRLLFFNHKACLNNHELRGTKTIQRSKLGQPWEQGLQKSRTARTSTEELCLPVQSRPFCLNLESGLFYKMMICFWNKHRLLISSEMIRPQKLGQWNAYTLPTLKMTFQIDNKRIIAKRVQVYLPIRWATNYQNSAQINALQFQKRRRIECIGQPKTYFGTGLQKRLSTPKFSIKVLKNP